MQVHKITVAPEPPFIKKDTAVTVGLTSLLLTVLYLTRVDRKDLQGLKLHKLFKKLRSASCCSDAVRKHLTVSLRAIINSCYGAHMTYLESMREGVFSRDAMIK